MWKIWKIIVTSNLIIITQYILFQWWVVFPPHIVTFCSLQNMEGTILDTCCFANLLMQLLKICLLTVYKFSVSPDRKQRVSGLPLLICCSLIIIPETFVFFPHKTTLRGKRIWLHFLYSCQTNSFCPNIVKILLLNAEGLFFPMPLTREMSSSSDSEDISFFWTQKPVYFLF